MSEIDDLRAVVARLEARVAELEGTSAAPVGPPSPGGEPIARRAALRRAGMLAAGAVAGGAGLVAATATPAAAATVNGSGAPGVFATGLGGDGLNATTNNAFSSAVYASTTVASAYSVFATHQGGGRALQASSTSSAASGTPVASVNNDGSGMALRAEGNPAVRAVGKAGDAVVATTNTTGKSALYAEGQTTGTFGVFATHGAGGQAFVAQATTTAASGLAAASVNTGTGSGTALKVDAQTVSGGPAAVRIANVGAGPVVTVTGGTDSAGAVVDVSNVGAGPALQVGGKPNLNGATTIGGTTTLNAPTTVNAPTTLNGAIRSTFTAVPPDNFATILQTAGTSATGLQVKGATNVNDPGGNVGVRVDSFRTGMLVSAEQTGLNVYGGDRHLFLFPDNGTAPPQRNKESFKGAVVQHEGDLWLCVADGTPGTWRKLAGSATAGAFHVLPAPARVYDSRPGTSPAVSPKTPLSANTPRPLDLRVNGSTVPAGATAALVTILLVNAASGNGNLTIWANGVAKPLANTMVWGGSTGRFTATAVTALDPNARVQVQASLATDLVLDVVGFYR